MATESSDSPLKAMRDAARRRAKNRERQRRRERAVELAASITVEDVVTVRHFLIDVGGMDCTCRSASVEWPTGYKCVRCRAWDMLAILPTIGEEDAT